MGKSGRWLMVVAVVAAGGLTSTQVTARHAPRAAAADTVRTMAIKSPTSAVLAIESTPRGPALPCTSCHAPGAGALRVAMSPRQMATRALARWVATQGTRQGARFRVGSPLAPADVASVD